MRAWRYTYGLCLHAVSRPLTLRSLLLNSKDQKSFFVCFAVCLHGWLLIRQCLSVGIATQMLSLWRDARLKICIYTKTPLNKL